MDQKFVSLSTCIFNIKVTCLKRNLAVAHLRALHFKAGLLQIAHLTRSEEHALSLLIGDKCESSGILMNLVTFTTQANGTSKLREFDFFLFALVINIVSTSLGANLL
jgi:hypothetical protein